MVKDGRVITKIVHSFDDEDFYLNQRNGRDYEAIRVDINDNYCYVVYTKSEYEQSEEVESMLPYGNAKSFTQPYTRTSPHVLTDVDCLASQNVNNNEIYDTLLERSGGPYHSKSLSDEPRNIQQIKNRNQQLKSSSKNNKQERQINYELIGFFNALENENIVQTISAVKSAYFLFLYNDRQINGIKRFCCEGDNPSVLPIDTIFNHCDLWITDTSSYQSKRLINRESRKKHIFVGSMMFHFAKDEGAFGASGRFVFELLAADPKLTELKNIGVDMESTIYRDSKNFIPSINRLLCVRHLKQRDEKKLDKLPNRFKQNAAGHQQA